MQPGATSIPSNPVAPKPIVKELYQFNYLGTYYSSCNYWSDKTKAEAKAEEKFTAPCGEDGRKKWLIHLHLITMNKWEMK